MHLASHPDLADLATWLCVLQIEGEQTPGINSLGRLRHGFFASVHFHFASIAWKIVHESPSGVTYLKYISEFKPSTGPLVRQNLHWHHLHF